MILPDLNLLIYAYQPHMTQHEKAAAWWLGVMNGSELIGLPYEVCLGFVRIATHPRLGPATVPLAEASTLVESWLALPHARVLAPSDDHFRQVISLLAHCHGSGSLVSDATLAAHAIHHRATLCSNDSDFARFAGLDWKNPLLE
jgi:uncharacterized protein